MATGTIPSHRGTKHLVKRHGYKLGYTVTKVHLQRAGLVVPAARRSAHRKKRPRRPLEGMLVHQDGSRFAWLPGDPRQYDLIVTLDDATSAIRSEEHTSELQSLMRISYAVFCLKKKTTSDLSE